MYRALVYLSLILGILFYGTHSVVAQVAPTNSATISGSVSDVGGKAVAGATVSVSGPRNASTQTDAHGSFVFLGLPFGTYQISATASALGTAVRTVQVQGDTNIAIQYEFASVNGLKTIANVKASANARFNVTPASVTQVNPLSKAFQGVTTWRTILEQIPGVAQAGVGNGQIGYAAIPDSPMMPMQISINGALPYETAILLDDMPLIGGSEYSRPGTGTNLATYPINGFGSADVVRGPGAGAPSIVDSIGGSFLLRPPGRTNENSYAFSLSTDPYGGIVANATGTLRWKKLSVTMTYGVNDSPGPSNSAAILSNLANTPPINVNGQTFSRYSPPPCPSCLATFLIAPNYSPNSLAYYGNQSGLLVCCINQDSAWSQHSGSLAVTYAFSPSVSAEIYYVGARSLMPVPSQNYTTDFTPPPGYGASIPAGMYLFPTADQFLVPEFAVNASSLIEEKITAQLGRGELRLAALQNRVFSSAALTSPISPLSVQLFGGGTLNGTAVLLNGNSYQLCSNSSANCSTGTYGAPTAVNGFSTTFALNTFTSNFQSDNRDFLLSYSTPLGERYHAGASFVESYYDNPQTIASTSFQIIQNGPVRSASIYQKTTEERLFIGGNLSDKTSLDLSMYFADALYHVPNPQPAVQSVIVGGVINQTNFEPSAYTDSRYSYSAPRLGFVWRPTASVAIRAAAGGGFAEAPLNTLVGNPGATPSCSGGVCRVTLANLNLQPERSFSFDVGTDIQLRRSTLLSFDVYRSNLYGQIYTATAILPSCPTCGGLPVNATQSGNLGLSRFEGVLVDIRHDVPRGIFWSGSGGLTRGYLVSVPAGFYNLPGQTCNFATDAGCKNENIAPNVNFNGEFAASVPYSQAIGTIGYRWSPEKYVSLTGTYYGNNNTYFRPAFFEVDGQLGYPLSKKISLVATFENITGIYDGIVQTYALGNLSGAPTVAGLPYPLYGENYGPRTIIVSTQVHL